MNLFLWTTRLSSRHFGVLEALRHEGFELIELPAADYSSETVRQIRHCLQQLGLTCTVATLLDEDHNPIASSARLRQRALDKLKADIDLCAALGAQALIGPMHSAHKQFHGRGPSPGEFERCVEVLGAAADYAGQAGVELCVEFLNRFECYFLNTTAQAAELVKAIDHPQLGILYDTHHAHIEESNPAEALRQHSASINHIHISESHRGTPGTGAVDWNATFASIRDSEYQGRLVIEAFATDVAEVASAVNIWRNCFESREQVYQQGLQLIRQQLNEDTP